MISVQPQESRTGLKPVLLEVTEKSGEPKTAIIAISKKESPLMSLSGM